MTRIGYLWASGHTIFVSVYSPVQAGAEHGLSSGCLLCHNDPGYLWAFSHLSRRVPSLGWAELRLPSAITGTQDICERSLTCPDRVSAWAEPRPLFRYHRDPGFRGQFPAPAQNYGEAKNKFERREKLTHKNIKNIIFWSAGCSL
jgi:hypothetical protein